MVTAVLPAGAPGATAPAVSNVAGPRVWLVCSLPSTEIRKLSMAAIVSARPRQKLALSQTADDADSNKMNRRVR